MKAQYSLVSLGVVQLSTQLIRVWWLVPMVGGSILHTIDLKFGSCEFPSLGMNGMSLTCPERRLVEVCVN